MKEINLTKGQVALVDDEDFEFLNQWKWQAHKDQHTGGFYARRGTRFMVKTITTIMHREIMNTPKDMVCDHIDHNTLNNQKSNLRNVTISQNAMNRVGEQKEKNKPLGVRGVHREGTGYRAQINIDKKPKKFSVRKTLEEAIADRKKAEIEHYGEYNGKS